MTTKPTLTIITLIALTSTAALAQRFDLRGDELGETMSNFQSRHHLHKLGVNIDFAKITKPGAGGRETYLYADGTFFAIQSPEMIARWGYPTIYHFDETHRLTEIQGFVSNSQYSATRQAMITKYGAPTKGQGLRRNGLGIETAGEVLTWVQPNGSVTLEEVGVHPNTSMYTIIDTTYQELLNHVTTPTF